MAKAFKRALPQELIIYKRDLDEGKNYSLLNSEVYEQFKCNLQKRLGTLISTITDTDDECVTENDLSSRIDELKISNKIYTEKSEENIKLKSKVKAVRSYNNDLKDCIIKSQSDIGNLQNSLTLVEKQDLQKRDEIVNCHKSYLLFYNLYKKCSGCKIDFESPQVIKFEFAPEIYIKLHSESWKSSWHLIDIKPDIINRNKLEEKLLETDDIQAFVGTIYKSFQPLLKEVKTSE